jgi:hypothetical protein
MERRWKIRDTGEGREKREAESRREKSHSRPSAMPTLATYGTSPRIIE